MPDWRDAAAYAPLLEADRSIVAWEWLRREPSYREAALRSPRQRGTPAAAAWGLVAFEDPDLAAPAARPVWTAEADASVLTALACECSSGRDTLDLERFGAMSTIVAISDRREHLLISDGLRLIRLDVLAGTLTQGPAELRYLLSGLGSAEKPLLTLRRFLALARTGRFSRSLHPREPRARRWALILRVHDALRAEADQREIARVLLSRDAGEPRWRSQAPSLRSRAQRLVREARRMAAGAYRRLLR